MRGEGGGGDGELVDFGVLSEEGEGAPGDDAKEDGGGGGDDDATVVGTEAGDGVFDGA